MAGHERQPSKIRRLAIAIAAMVISAGSVAVMLFLIAGRWNLPWFQAYVVFYALFCFAAMLLLDPGLIRERLRPGPGGRDKASVGLAKLLASLQYVLAALDVGRFEWTGRVPFVVHAAGLAVAVLCAGGLIWTMRVNRFFSTVVRIQHERGHHVVTDGPYRVVRHPGYILVVVLLLATAPALGSAWALAPAVAVAVLLMRRTVVEDQFLREHLPDYADYARVVRFRWIPGLW
jgi:protein-S-isoprenylcysteine O-methyltransferase Ste14